MRIVAGTARGRLIVSPEGESVRPTSDRAREAIFNSLFSHDLLEGARFVDLFAGSGALGLEALSRGAGHVTFVDSSRASIACVEQNLAHLGFGSRSTVRRGDALDYIGAASGFDVALLDPPYAFDRWSELLERVDARAVVIESDRPIDPGENRRILKQKRYGGTFVTIAASDDPTTRPEGDSTPAEQEAPRR